MPINTQLADSRNLSQTTRQEITDVHRELDYLLNNPHVVPDPVVAVENLEYQLQELWGFPQDCDCHSHWWRIKGCTCPSLDNKDRLGTGYRVIAGDCPWHTGKEK